MSGIVIVPNALRDAIYRKLDAAIAENPDAETGREQMFGQLLDFYDEHGYIPEFRLEKKVLDAR